jgi:hypothetical protein
MRFHGPEVAVRLSTDKCLFVERVKCFARWHEDQFDVLDEPREPVANHAGWKRGGEYWIRPDIWRDTIFEGNEIASVDAARTLRDLGLLRVQDTRNFQGVVGVRNHKTARAYVVKPEIREWKPTEPVYGIYGAPQIGLSSSQGNGAESPTYRRALFLQGERLWREAGRTKEEFLGSRARSQRRKEKLIAGAGAILPLIGSVASATSRA